MHGHAYTCVICVECGKAVILAPITRVRCGATCRNLWWRVWAQMKTILAVMYRLLQDLLGGVFGKVVIGDSNTGAPMMAVVF